MPRELSEMGIDDLHSEQQALRCAWDTLDMGHKLTESQSAQFSTAFAKVDSALIHIDQELEARTDGEF